MRISRRTFLASTAAAMVAPSALAAQNRAAADARGAGAAGVRVQLVRNATCRIAYGGKMLLFDPWLGDVGSYPAVRNAPNPRPNPLVPLPMPLAGVLAGVDATFLTHTHFDHWDAAERNAVPKSGPVFVQPADAERLTKEGFTGVRPVRGRVEWDGIAITPTAAQHGTGDVAVRMGAVTGYVLRRAGLPTLYVAGDTVWFDGVAAALREHKPDVVIVNAGEARFLEGDPIIMGVADVANVCRAVPSATVIAVHMEAVNHCLLTRAGLRAGLEAAGLASRVRIPADGETIDLA